MTEETGYVYELVVAGPVGPVIENALRPCSVLQRAEVQTVVRGVLTTSIVELMQWFDERDLVVSRVAVVG
jgi:hypothetical protein